MKPHRKNILFKPFPSETERNGLEVPEAFRQMNSKGVVVEIGNMVTKLKKGDIGFKVWSEGATGWCHEVIIGGEKHYILEENSIIALQ